MGWWLQQRRGRSEVAMGGMQPAVKRLWTSWHDRGEVTRGAQNARCGDSKIPKRNQARDKDGNATAWGGEIGPGLGKRTGSPAGRLGEGGHPGDATGGPHVGGRGDARPGPLPALGSAWATLGHAASSREAAAAARTRALVTQPVARPPPPPLPPAEATRATPLPGHRCPEIRLLGRARARQ